MLVFLGFYSSLGVVSISKFISIIKLFLSQYIGRGMTFFFLVFLLILLGSLGAGMSEYLCGTSLLDGVKPEHHIKPFNYTFQ